MQVCDLGGEPTGGNLTELRYTMQKPYGKDIILEKCQSASARSTLAVRIGEKMKESARWSKIIPIKAKSQQKEVWQYNSSEGTENYNVDVRLGKPLDFLAFKSKRMGAFKADLLAISKSRKDVFKNKKNLEHVKFCPVCGYDTESSIEAVNIYNAIYRQCSNCAHYFVVNRPSPSFLESFYSEDEQYQGPYTDKNEINIRVLNIVAPKLDWVIKQFKRVYGREPKSILDVGTGSGHFVHLCRERGLKADGVELSKTGIEFCKNNFNIELFNVDFISEWSKFRDYDIICFWGVLEHVPYPCELLSAASMALSGKEGLVIAEVPRWDSISTAVQEVFSDSITRHLDPLGHISCFTDTSLATLFRDSGFDITAAWYFGMDAYEWSIQLSNLFGKNKVNKKMKELMPIFQQTLDKAKLSDEVVIVGKPSEKAE